MRIVTFNVQHGRGLDGVVDVPRLVDACAGLDADVLAIQEVDAGLPRSGGADLAASVAAATGMHHHFVTAMQLDGGQYGHALLVRGELDEIEEVDLPRQRRREPRVAVLACVQPRRGHTFSVAATHLSFHDDEVNQQLDAVVAALVNRPAPRVLMGDLNAGARLVERATQAAGLRRAPSGSTWPAGLPRRALDHVLVDGLDLETVEVVSLPVSDHRAVVVSVRPVGDARAGR